MNVKYSYGTVRYGMGWYGMVPIFPGTSTYGCTFYHEKTNLIISEFSTVLPVIRYRIVPLRLMRVIPYLVCDWGEWNKRVWQVPENKQRAKCNLKPRMNWCGKKSKRIRISTVRYHTIPARYGIVLATCGIGQVLLLFYIRLVQSNNATFGK